MLLVFVAPLAAVMLFVLAFPLGMLGIAWELATRGDGYTYSIDPALGANGMAGARDAFFAWSDANDGIYFKESAWDDADVRVGWMETTCVKGLIVRGCACLGLWPGCPAIDNAFRRLACSVPDGATIGVSPGVHAINGTLVPYTREQMRDLVAHELGHNLGLHHNTGNLSHLMYGRDGIPFYSDLGYAVPDAVVHDWTPTIPVSEWDAPDACG